MPTTKPKFSSPTPTVRAEVDGMRKKHLTIVKMLNATKRRIKKVIESMEGTEEGMILQGAYSAVGNQCAEIQLAAMTTLIVSFGQVVESKPADGEDHVAGLTKTREHMEASYTELLRQFDGMMQSAYEARAEQWIKEAKNGDKEKQKN